MKKYEAPEIKIVTFMVEDIITTSDELPFVPFSVNTDELEIAKISKPQ